MFREVVIRAAAVAALYAGLVSSGSAQEYVPVVFLDVAEGGEACSGPLAGQAFSSTAAAIAAAEAAVEACAESYAPYYCGDRISRDVQAHWKWRQIRGRYEFGMLFQTFEFPGCSGGRRGEVYFVIYRPLECGPNPDACDGPDPCTELAGRSFLWSYDDTETRGAVCVTLSGTRCRLQPIGVHACIRGVCSGNMKITGEYCVNEPEPGEDETLEMDPATENCISTGTMSLCYRADEKNCGWINGERWCAPETMREGCISTASGAMVCVGDAGPTDETGELLPADEEFVVGEGAGAGSEPGNDREWRYYARDTVASGGGVVRSSRPSEGDVGEGGDGGGGDYPGLDEGESWSGSMDGFWSRVADTPWGQALSVSGIPDGGECPTATFEFFGQEMTISAHCDLIEEFSGLLGIVFLFGWSLLGVRIILSA